MGGGWGEVGKEGGGVGEEMATGRGPTTPCAVPPRLSSSSPSESLSLAAACKGAIM